MLRCESADGIGAPEIHLRVPGTWTGPERLAAALPDGYTLTSSRLVLPDGSAVELHPIPADRMFPTVFDTASRFELSAHSRRALRRATLYAGVIGEGGSLAAARRMLDVAAALVHAGGAGVFVDGGIVAHAREDVLDLAASSGSGPLLFAYTNLVRGAEEVRSFGMHALGRPDVRVPCNGGAGDDALVFAVLGLLRVLCEEPGVVTPGSHCGFAGIDLRAVRHEYDRHPRASPVHNPYGQWLMEVG